MGINLHIVQCTYLQITVSLSVSNFKFDEVYIQYRLQTGSRRF